MPSHFILQYATQVNEILHAYLITTWYYKHEIYEVPGLLSALLITYDNQKDDAFLIQPQTSWQDFLGRMSRVKPDWAYFSRGNMEGLGQHPDKVMCGWEGRTIYFIRGGSHPEYWTPQRASMDTLLLLKGGAHMYGPLIKAYVENVHKSILPGAKHSRKYEDFVRIVLNYLFMGQLGECKAQPRTEPGNDACEIRDLLCQNVAEGGFWKDIKEKYACSDALFEAKNKLELNRNDLRQTYCYLKPVLSLWGVIVCRSEQPAKVHAYNRTLFKNFLQARGVFILTDDDLKRMVQMKLRNQDPSAYLRDKMSEFIRSV
jgi:hypothetical protein